MYLKPSIETDLMSNPSLNKHSTSTLTHDEVIISIASPSEASSSSPSELKRNNVNKFWKALKQNLRSYCWWSCFKPVAVVSKMKENPSTKRSNSTTMFKSMKTTSTNGTGSSYSNTCVDEHEQMIKEAILYCKNSMKQVSVVDLEAFEIDHSNESVSKADLKAFVDEGIVMLSSTDQEQVRAANVSAATMVSDPSAVDVSREEEEEVLDNAKLPLDEEEELVRGTFANGEEEEEPYLGEESEQLTSPLPISATAPTLLEKKDLLIEKLEKEIKELILQQDLAQSRLDDLLQEVVGDDRDSRLWADFDPTNKSKPSKEWESENSSYESPGVTDNYSSEVTSVSRFSTYPLSNEDSENRCCDECFLFNGTSLQISMDTSMFAAGHDLHQSSEWITQGTNEDTTVYDLCKEVRSIEMEKFSTNRNVGSLTLSPEELRKEGISSLTMVANGDLTYLQEPVVASSANTNEEFSLVRTDSAFCFHFPQYIY